MDRKEDFLTALNLILAKSGINQRSIAQIRDGVVQELAKYDLTDRSQELAAVDQDSQRYIILYLGTLGTEGKSKRTLRAYGDFLNRFHREIGKPLPDVSCFDIRFWLSRKQQEVSLRSCENYRSYLSAFYNWMAAEGLMPANPMAKIKPVQYVQEEKRPFSTVDLDMMRAACSTLRQRALLELLLSSGSRVSELCAMNRNDVDMAAKSILIRCGKGGKQRTVYITDVCRMHLAAYLNSRTDSNASLFVNRFGGRFTKSSAEDELHKIGDLSGVDNVHPHRCRRTFATGMYQRGMDIATIQRLMGHTNISTTMTYIAMADNRVKYEYQRLA